MRTNTYLAAAIALLLVSGCGPDEPPTPTGPTTGAIDVTSTPSGAAIFLNDEDTGRVTPNAFVELQAGPYEVKLVLPQYEDWVRTVTVTAGSSTAVRAILVGPLVGAIDVSSTPSGASIFLNGTNTGRLTPSTITDLAPGPYEVKLLLRNYDDWVQTVTVIARQTTRLDAVLRLKCPGEVIGDLNLPPTITILNLRPGDRSVQGMGDNFDARRFRGVGAAKTDIWYVQPFVDRPFTPICADGSWRMSTHPWVRFVVLLVDSTFVPRATWTNHPATSPGVVAWDEYPEPSTDQFLWWSGYRWWIKTGDPVGPGPNCFSDNERNVWLENGDLHLKIEFHDNRWCCGEVVLDHALGYGTYTYQLASRVDNFDPETASAGFVYERDDREVDIECAGDSLIPGPGNAQYVIQPHDRAGNLHRFTMPAEAQTSHRFIWQAGQIEFVSWTGWDPDPTEATLIQRWIYTGSYNPPAGGERMRFNLWLVRGLTPANGTGDELILRSFTFRPVS